MLGAYFYYSHLPDSHVICLYRLSLFCNVPDCTRSSLFCQKLCHSRSFLYTPIHIALYSSSSQSQSPASSIPGNQHYKNLEIRTELSCGSSSTRRCKQGIVWVKADQMTQWEKDKLSKHTSSSHEGVNSCYQSGFSSVDNYRGAMFIC